MNVSRYSLLIVIACINFISLQGQSNNLKHPANRAEYDQLRAQGKAMLVDVYAPWCGPCQKISPMIDELAAEYPDVLFVKVNGDTPEFRSFVTENKIDGYPMFFFYASNGSEAFKPLDGAIFDKSFFQKRLNEMSSRRAPAGEYRGQVPAGQMRTMPAPTHEEIVETMPRRKVVSEPEKKAPATKLMNIIKIDTPNQFIKEVLQSTKPVIIQFVEQPCQICEKLAAVINTRIATHKDYKDFKFVQIDISNKKFQGILPKSGGLLILPDYQFINMQDFEHDKTDKMIELRVRRAIMTTHNIPISMPGNMPIAQNM